MSILCNIYWSTSGEKSMSIEITCLSNKISKGEIRGRGKTRYEETRHDKIGHDNTWQDKTSHTKTIQDNAIEDSPPQENHNRINKTLSCLSKFWSEEEIWCFTSKINAFIGGSSEDIFEVELPLSSSACFPILKFDDHLVVVHICTAFKTCLHNCYIAVPSSSIEYFFLQDVNTTTAVRGERATNWGWLLMTAVLPFLSWLYSLWMIMSSQQRMLKVF